MRHLIFISIACIALISCKTTEITQANESDISVPAELAVETTELTATIGTIEESDALTIMSAIIDGNTMTVVVQYSGGCQEHDIQMVGADFIMKSLPPKRKIALIHNSNGDHCRELITKTLEIDITQLAANPTSGSEIILLLDGYSAELSYIYQ